MEELKNQLDKNCEEITIARIVELLTKLTRLSILGMTTVGPPWASSSRLRKYNRKNETINTTIPHKKSQ